MPISIDSASSYRRRPSLHREVVQPELHSPDFESPPPTYSELYPERATLPASSASRVVPSAPREPDPSGTLHRAFMPSPRQRVLQFSARAPDMGIADIAQVHKNKMREDIVTAFVLEKYRDVGYGSSREKFMVRDCIEKLTSSRAKNNLRQDSSLRECNMELQDKMTNERLVESLAKGFLHDLKKKFGLLNINKISESQAGNLIDYFHDVQPDKFLSGRYGATKPGMRIEENGTSKAGKPLYSMWIDEAGLASQIKKNLKDAGAGFSS